MSLYTETPPRVKSPFTCSNCTLREGGTCLAHETPIDRLNKLCRGEGWQCHRWSGTKITVPNGTETVPNDTGVSWVLRKCWGHINTSGDKRRPIWTEYWHEIASSHEEQQERVAA